MKNRILTYFLMLTATLFLVSLAACDRNSSDAPKSASGVSKATVKVPTNHEGLTTEQQNVRDRLLADNAPGSIKHLYVISAYSGQVLVYSTVRGKVTSSGKRLSPTRVVDEYNEGYDFFPVNIGGEKMYTDEVLQDDGTYGSSVEYLYWWDTKGVFHQHYVSGGQILHVSSEPLSVKSVVINMEVEQKDAPPPTAEKKTN